MKRLKWWIVAFLAGEFLTMMKKDDEFKQWVTEKTGWEKVKHILDWLFDFNKQLVEEVKEKFDSTLLEDQLHQGRDRVLKEYERLTHEIEIIKAKGTILTQEMQIQLQERFDALQHTAELVKETITEFPVQEKLAALKKTLDSFAKSTKNI